MRAALVAIGRRENDYAREWVEHHLASGFDHIIIYDNNHNGEEYFETVLGSYIVSGRVEIIDFRNKESAQRMAYNDAYTRFGSQYDWLAFFDFDEFLCFNEETSFHPSGLKAFLATIPPKYDAVMIPWLMMTDSGLVRNDHRPLMQRFTESTTRGLQQGKCIIRTGIRKARFTKSVHIPYEPVLNCCSPTLQPAQQSRLQPRDTTVAYLKHFSTKTIEEWLANKMQKGTAGRTMKRFENSYRDYFFTINELTPEKEAFIQQFGYPKGKVAAVARGRLGNQMFIAAAAMTFACRTGRKFTGLVYTGSQARRLFLYPPQQFGSVMRNVCYFEDDKVDHYHHLSLDKPHHSQGFPDVGNVPNVVLDDYFQNAKLIDRDIALQLFSLRQEALDEARRIYGDLSDCVCVCVRRGDYLKHIKQGYRILSAGDIYTILYEYFPRNEYPRVCFVSDDIAWCRQNFKGGNYVFADGRSSFWKTELDLAVQTLCRGNIISNSTFSWWGAYLGKQEGRRVVCPWPWFLPQHSPQLNDILPDGWIKHRLL